jgi:pyrroloquinoline quinone biosynthesis protein B
MKTPILVLGSGQDGGSPQVGRRRGIGPDRTASCVAVVSPNGSVVILDASPDIRVQTQRLQKWKRYPSERDRLVDSVAITHGHMGHYAGLLHFGKEAAAERGLPLVATISFLEFLSANEPWRALVAGGHLRPEPLADEVSIDSSMSIAGIPVPHRAEYTDTVALSIRSNDTPVFLFLPDIDSWDAWPAAEGIISEHAAVLVDATFSSFDELPGRDMSHIAHPLVPDTIDRFSHLTATTTIVLGHMNHTNRLADPSSEIGQTARDAGYVIAIDGLEI